MLAFVGAIGCLVPYILLLAAIMGMNIVYKRTSGVLSAGVRIMHGVNRGALVGSKAIAAPFITVRRRMAWAGHVLRLPPPSAR